MERETLIDKQNIVDFTMSTHSSLNNKLLQEKQTENIFFVAKNHIFDIF